MAPDYDLSNLPTDQADLWIYLQVDAIFGQIMADQAERLGFPPRSRGLHRFRHDREAAGDIQQWVTGSGRIGVCLQKQGGFKFMSVSANAFSASLNCPGRGGRSSLARQQLYSDGGLH